VTGSQKAMMLPAGLTFVAVSDKAWQAIEKNEEPRFYLDLLKYRNNLDKNSTPYTPALSLIFGLEQALNLLKEEGLENAYARHTLTKDTTRRAMKAIRVPLLTDDSLASLAVTPVKADNFEPGALRKSVKNNFNLSLAGRQAPLTREIFR